MKDTRATWILCFGIYAFITGVEQLIHTWYHNLVIPWASIIFGGALIILGVGIFIMEWKFGPNWRERE